MNTCRDPRWGRCQEGYGECPLLSAEMVRTYMRGIQGPADAKHIKVCPPKLTVPFSQPPYTLM